MTCKSCSRTLQWEYMHSLICNERTSQGTKDNTYRSTSDSDRHCFVFALFYGRYSLNYKFSKFSSSKFSLYRSHISSVITVMDTFLFILIFAWNSPRIALRICTIAIINEPKASVPRCQKLRKNELKSGRAGTSSGFLKAKYQLAKAPARVHCPTAVTKLIVQ